MQNCKNEWVQYIYIMVYRWCAPIRFGIPRCPTVAIVSRVFRNFGAEFGAAQMAEEAAPRHASTRTQARFGGDLIEGSAYASSHSQVVSGRTRQDRVTWLLSCSEVWRPS
jgi:hypothetical protein